MNFQLVILTKRLVGEGGGVRGAGQGGKRWRVKMIDQEGVAYNRDGKRTRGKLKGGGKGVM